MLHPAFNISPKNMIAGEINLFGEVGNDGFSYILQDEKEKKIVGLSAYEFAESNTETGAPLLFRKIFHEQQFLPGDLKKIVISFAFQECILVPEEYYNASGNAENIHLVFGDLHQGIILADYIEEKKLYAVYRIPHDIYHAVINDFPLATFCHQYSIIIKQLPPTGTLLKVIVYHDKIVTALVIENKLQIIQTFFYLTPEDVLYHMLNICRQFETSALNVELSGIIDKDSPVYKEIRACFTNVHFTMLAEDVSCVEEIKQFPLHFFSHLFAIASCV